MINKQCIIRVQPNVCVLKCHTTILSSSPNVSRIQLHPLRCSTSYTDITTICKRFVKIIVILTFTFQKLSFKYLCLRVLPFNRTLLYSNSASFSFESGISGSYMHIVAYTNTRCCFSHFATFVKILLKPFPTAQPRLENQ